jgi:hypothetical protein
MDTKTITEGALNALTSLESKDAPNHPSQLSAEPDSSYTTETVLITAQADSWQTPKEPANLAEIIAFNANRRTPARNAHLIMSSTTDNAYPNVLLDMPMSSDIASLVLKTLALNADLKTETTVSLATTPSSHYTDIAFLPALMENSNPETDAESVTLHALLAVKKAHALLADLNSLYKKMENVLPDANPEKSLFKTLVSLVKTPTAYYALLETSTLAINVLKDLPYSMANALLPVPTVTSLTLLLKAAKNALSSVTLAMLLLALNAQRPSILSRETPDTVFLAETSYMSLKTELAPDANLLGA